MSKQSKPNPDRITSFWRNQQFEDLSSFTRMSQPVKLQELGQRLLRDGMVRVIRALAADQVPFPRLVDLGCGIGDWEERYASLADEVVGVEINENFLAEARRRNTAHPNVRFESGDMRSWRDFQRDDFVCLGGTLMFVDDDVTEDIFTSLSQMQQSGSRVYVRATTTHGDRLPTTTDGGYYRGVAQYLSLFDRHGYDVEFEEPSINVAVLYGLYPSLLPLDASAVRGRARRAGTPMTWIRRVLRERDFYNWLLRRR